MVLQTQVDLHGYETITLALHILGTSDFTGAQLHIPLTIANSFVSVGHNLSEVVRVCTIPYLSDEHPKIRQTAALTACMLIAVDPVCFQTSDYSVGILMDMLDRLLTLSVADQGERNDKELGFQ